jgi:UDP-galactopyranose mutase
LADVVFTGGYSLWEAKRGRHANIHPFPSSVDQAHFAKARVSRQEPADQAALPWPRLGFYGVIDERMDLDLLAALADARPNWSVVLVGPVVKVDPADLPKRANLHYLGGKAYEELPHYLGGWDVALMPFAINDSTRFISPTKTPEYLAAGLPVVSTSIRDVIFPYGNAGIVHIADTPEEFIVATEKALAEDPAQRVKRVDALLSQTSWSRTWGRMAELLEDAIQRRKRPASGPRVAKQLAAAAAAGGPA